MNKKIRVFLSSILLCGFIFTAAVPAYATPGQPSADSSGTELRITSEEDFLRFADSCLLDTYSQNLTVYLEQDLDLSEIEFSGIPTFSGIFEGRNHIIKGVFLVQEGSVQGLFRYLTPDAFVRNLSVEGCISPEGSRQDIGGIAGNNAGHIENCSFNGEITGSDRIGGLVGTNQVTGIIDSCQVTGTVCGNHFIGGLAGQNSGLIRGSINYAQVNTTSNDSQISLSDISTDTIVGTESADTVTDIGGIAGSSSGMIRSCQNQGTVGYPHVGYNIGGIAGSQNGFITESTNFGSIFGRKEVAGIVGQMEPVSRIHYTEDTLQILEQQLAGTSALANRASSNVHSNVQNLKGQIASLHAQSDIAMDAIRQLLPGPDNPSFPDRDSLIAAQNTLSSSISSMQNTVDSLTSSAHSGATTISNDINAITNQISAMSQTIGNAAENLGGTIRDISDEDQEEDYTGKVSLCRNQGAVSGDLNVGGIAGTAGLENDFDPEDDLIVTGDRSLNFDSELRAVVLRCENNGTISAKKKNTGGIAGQISVGLIRECISTGTVEAKNSSYIGGIVGTSHGYIRSCSSKCQLSGSSYIGGIAGYATIVTDCRSMTEISEGFEKLGAVIGIAAQPKETETPSLSGNYFLPTSRHPGAIDGINYQSVAEPLTQVDFLALENLSDIFQASTLTFFYPDGRQEHITVALGHAIEEREIPAVPPRAGFIGKWDRLDSIDMQNVQFDTMLNAEYIPCRTVLSSKNVRSNGKPILLAEGEFYQDLTLELTFCDDLPTISDSVKIAEAWNLPDFYDNMPDRLRVSLPENLPEKQVRLLIRSINGTWTEMPAVIDGSYLVFHPSADDTAFCLIQTSGMAWIKYALIGGTLLTVLIGLSCALIYRSKHKNIGC